ncbi:SLIT and NTRK-like protein 5 [Lates japonicus]|uniref:SLIT and NTRK-like protein 5 n=1 Tax=Lates japonicus TaxID=270547 RepID=A0AAD3REY6_LATJO|nr:SLIT and NTRK-like protein 5 [Lates japonicus]
MNSVVELQLEENPWNCSCELIALKTWLESISYTALVGDVVCEFPFRLHGRDLDEVSKQELCPRRAIAEYEMPSLPHLSSDAYYRTTPALATASFTSSGIARSSSRPTKGPRHILELKMWLEQLSTGTVLNNVICGSPKKLAGEDMRYIKIHFAQL